MHFVLKIETFQNFNNELIFAKILIDKQFNLNSFSKLRKDFAIFVF